MRRLDDAIVAGATTIERARQKNTELMERKERATRQLESGKQREELKGELVQAVMLLESDLGAIVKALPDEALTKLCRLVFGKVTLEAEGSSHHREAWVAAYAFSPEFADLVAHSTRMVELGGLEPPSSSFSKFWSAKCTHLNYTTLPN